MASGKQHPVTYMMWALLIGSAFLAVLTARWSLLFISLVTLGMTLLPLYGARRTGIVLPTGFIAAVTFFIVGTIFPAEVGDFYERFWWWDVLRHTGSAVGFGMIGTVIVLFLLQGDRLAASPFVAALLAFSFAVSIGAVWELFEFSMDQLFGTNMQKSGLVDTMADIAVDCVGAFVGAAAGYGYLAGHAADHSPRPSGASPRTMSTTTGNPDTKEFNQCISISHIPPFLPF